MTGAKTKPQSTWRDHLPVHPAADLFPLMSEPELRELGEDIKAHGLSSPICLYDGKLIDGRNRLDAMELVGVKFEWGAECPGPKNAPHCHIKESVDPYAYVLGANLHRRHLTSEQKRELIDKLLKARPEASNNIIAKQIKADNKTVAKRRRKLESTSEIPKLKKTVGADGKARAKPKRNRAPEEKSVEESAKERRAYYEATENEAIADLKSAAASVDRIFTDMGLPVPPSLSAQDNADDQKADGNPIWIAWSNATPAQRREFTKLMMDDLAREHDATAHDEARR